MTRKSLVYSYRPVPDQLPASKHKTGVIDTLDAAIESLWTPDIKNKMQPLGHPQSKRFFIQQYEAAKLIQEGASEKGLFSITNLDIWTLMKALRRVADRRGISPAKLLKSSTPTPPTYDVKSPPLPPIAAE